MSTLLCSTWAEPWKKSWQSWFSIGILSILTILEIVGKCIPAVDELIDSVEVFVVPVLSAFATLGTMGVFDLIVKNGGNVEDNGDVVPADDAERMLGEAGETFLTFWKVVLVLWGIGLALLIHFFKMIIRISGLVCCMGCCQPCITIIEITCVCCGVVFAIFIRQIAVILCVIFLLAAAYTIKVKCFTKKEEEEVPIGDTTNNTNGGTEQPKPPATEQPATATIDEKGDNAGDAPQDVENPPPYAPASNDMDPENPPPTAPTAQVVSYAEVIPLPPPPASNPNYVAADIETPMAIAVAVMDDPTDQRKSIPEDKKTKNEKGKTKSASKEEEEKKKKNSAVIY
jgi:Domain of unknown function (DUF4126)